MKKKIKYFFKDFIKNNYKLIIIYLILILMVTVKLDYLIYSPGGLINLDDRIIIENSYESSGSINMTYVRGRSGTILFTLLSFVIPSWDLVPFSDSQIGNESEEEVNDRNRVYLSEVSEIAKKVAFDELNKDYSISEEGVSVLYVYDLADTNIKAGDIIISIENHNIKNINDLSKILEIYENNQKINIKALRNGKEISVYAHIKNNENKKIIGVAVSNKVIVNTSPKVNFKFNANEGGPSGGLMTTLKIYDMLNKYDVTKGRVIAGTGTIDEDGNIGEISGIKYKLSGSVRKKADIFLCPSGNYEECLSEKEKNNYDIEIIKADNFKNVLNKLK